MQTATKCYVEPIWLVCQLFVQLIIHEKLQKLQSQVSVKVLKLLVLWREAATNNYFHSSFTFWSFSWFIVCPQKNF